MRRAFSVLAFTAVLASAPASFTILPERTRVAGSATATFLVPTQDGYGVGECLASGGACGKEVADAWCEAHGFARAVSLGPAAPEDATGSVETVSTVIRERLMAVACAR
jgi:hypothetical protein